MEAGQAPEAAPGHPRGEAAATRPGAHAAVRPAIIPVMSPRRDRPWPAPCSSSLHFWSSTTLPWASTQQRFSQAQRIRADMMTPKVIRALFFTALPGLRWIQGVGKDDSYFAKFPGESHANLTGRKCRKNRALPLQCALRSFDILSTYNDRDYLAASFDNYHHPRKNASYHLDILHGHLWGKDFRYQFIKEVGLSGGAGLGSLSSTAVRYLGSGGWYAKFLKKSFFKLWKIMLSCHR